MAEIVVSRLIQYPTEEPDSFAVGFTVTCTNGRVFYMDTSVSFSEVKTDVEAVKIAYQRLKEHIDNQVAVLENKSSLIGQNVNNIVNKVIEVVGRNDDESLESKQENESLKSEQENESSDRIKRSGGGSGKE